MTQTPPRTFTAIDAMIAVAMICGAIAAFATANTIRPDRVAVYRQNTVIAEYPLKDDISFSVNGKIGPVGIEIKDGTASITRAACPKGICTKAGATSNPNVQLICAPNNIMIRILPAGGSGKDGGVDGVTY
jgi:hypothetical protein